MYSSSSFDTSYNPTQQLDYEMEFGQQDLINIPGAQGMQPDPRFHANLVEFIHEGELERIGNKLTEQISSDDRDRVKWLQILTQGIEQLGIGVERARSTGSNKDADLYATTFLTECLKITCKLFSIFFPGRKFAETKIYGYVNKAIEEQSFRCSEFFDYYTNEVMTEYLTDSEQALWWSVLGGSSFVKPYYDPLKGRIVAPFIMPQNIIISAGASSIYDAERITHRFSMSKRQMEANFDGGIWIKRHVQENSQYTDPVTQKVNEVTGLVPTSNQDNENYMFDECWTRLKIRGFEEIDRNGEPTPRDLPYRVIKDKNSSKIVGIWRNYNENDTLFRPKIGIIQHKYFTGFNAYGLGMIHLALGPAKTETKIQQQLINGAILSNMPSMIKNSGLRTERTQMNFTPGSVLEVSTFGQPLQNAFMPVPFTPPAPVMMDLVNHCGSKIQNISIAREIKADDIPSNTSATTILGILSTTNDMPNSLIKSYHRSYTKEFQLIYDILGEILPDEPYPFLTPGTEQSVMKKDFSPNIRIHPIMDPSNSSQTMQMLTNEVLMTISEQHPEIYNIREVQKRILGSLKIQDIDSILVPEQQEQPIPQLDPVSENMYVLQGKPIKAYKMQDHASHILVHQDEIQRLSMDQTKDNTAFIASLMAHNTEHDMWAYAAEMEANMGQSLPEDASQLPPEVQNEIAMKAAQAVQAKQQQQQQENPPPMDPSIPLMEENRVKEKSIELEAHNKEEQRKVEYDKLQQETMQSEVEMQFRMRQLDMEERKLVIEEKRLMILLHENEKKTQVELAKLQLDQDKADLQAETKVFGDTLRYENDSNRDIEMMKLDLEKEQSDLEAQSKAFDTVMSHQNDERSDETKAKKE